MFVSECRNNLYKKLGSLYGCENFDALYETIAENEAILWFIVTFRTCMRGYLNVSKISLFRYFSLLHSIYFSYKDT